MIPFTVHTIAADGTEADVTIAAPSKAEAVAIAHERQYAQHGLTAGAWYPPRDLDLTGNPPFGGAA